MRLIDADSLSRRVKTECNPYGKPTIEYESGCKVMEWIDSAQTVDAVPVVRCGECLYHKRGNCIRLGHPFLTPKDDFYCKCGIKREE